MAEIAAPPAQAPAAAPAAAPSNDMAQYFPGDLAGTSRESMKGVFDGLDKKSRSANEQGEIPRHPADRRPPTPENKAPTPSAEEETDETPPDDAPAPENKDTKQELRPDGKPKRPSDHMREEIARQKKRADELESKYKDIEPKYKDAETKAARLAEYEAKIAAMEKRQAAIEDDYRLYNYEKSDHYKQNFEKPYADAYNAGRRNVLELEVTLPDGSVRPAKVEDFDAIMQIANPAQANKLAKEMFPDSFAEVISDRKEALRKLASMQGAIEEAKKTGAEKMKQHQEMSQRQQQAVTKAWEDEIKQVEAKREWMRPIEGDETWNKALARGKELADKAFMADRSKVPPEELARLDAANYARSRMYSTLKLSNKRLSTKVKELEVKLKQYEGSEPGAGSGKHDGDTPPPTGSTLDQAMGGLDKYAKERTNFY